MRTAGAQGFPGFILWYYKNFAFLKYGMQNYAEKNSIVVIL
jgi:hypothetical protein